MIKLFNPQKMAQKYIRIKKISEKIVKLLENGEKIHQNKKISLNLLNSQKMMKKPIKFEKQKKILTIEKQRYENHQN